MAKDRDYERRGLLTRFFSWLRRLLFGIDEDDWEEIDSSLSIKPEPEPVKQTKQAPVQQQQEKPTPAPQRQAQTYQQKPPTQNRPAPAQETKKNPEQQKLQTVQRQAQREPQQQVSQRQQWPTPMQAAPRDGRYSRNRVIRSEAPPAGTLVRREISSPQIPRYRGSDPSPANIPIPQHPQRRVPPQVANQPRQQTRPGDVISQHKRYDSGVEDVFAEIEAVVNEAEEEAALLNQGPNSSSGKRARVLALGVPEPLYDELYEQGYFDHPNITQEYVREVLMQYYAKDFSSKIIKGEIDFNYVRELTKELQMLKENKDLTLSELNMSNDMLQLLDLTNNVVRRIKR